ncbi:hypothetical protein HKD37_16G045425 [Glycine soja]
MQQMNDEEVVRGIFGIHLDAIKLLNAFNIVLLMNNMYKTNKYRFPLVELVAEWENNLVWALERFKGLFMKLDTLAKNMKARCKMYVSPKMAWDQVMDSWASVMNCPTKFDYEDRVTNFKVVSGPRLVEYVNGTTDKVMHLGNITTNMVESAHWSLKRLLQSSI